jgi:hypothetical protein
MNICSIAAPDRKRRPAEPSGWGKAGVTANCFLQSGLKLVIIRARGRLVQTSLKRKSRQIVRSEISRDPDGEIAGDGKKGAHPEAIEKPAIPGEHRLYG